MDSASQSYDPTRASKKIEQIFTGIVKAMQKTGFLTHHLSASYGLGLSNMHFKREAKLADEVEHAKYMGLCKHPRYTRHRSVSLWKWQSW